MNRIDKLLAELRATKQASKPILCRTSEGEEMSMGIIEAMRTGCTFIRTSDGNHDYDELYKGLLSGEVDFSDLPEVE